MYRPSHQRLQRAGVRLYGDDCAARTRQGGGLPNRRGDTHGRNRGDAGLHRAAANPLTEKTRPTGQGHCNRMPYYLRTGFGCWNPTRRAGDGDAHYRYLSGSGSHPRGVACHRHHCAGAFGQPDGQKECGDSAAARGGNTRLCQCNLLGQNRDTDRKPYDSQAAAVRGQKV